MNPIGKALFILGPLVVGVSYLFSSFVLAPMADPKREPASLAPREAVAVALPSVRAKRSVWTPSDQSVAVPLDDKSEKSEPDRAAALVTTAESALAQKDYETAAEAAESALDLIRDDGDHLIPRAELVLQQVDRALDEIEAR